MRAQEVVEHFAHGRVREWMAWAAGKNGKRSRMVLGIFLDRRNYVAIPLSFKSEVNFNYCPFYQVSLN